MTPGERFYRALDLERASRGMSWREVAARSGVSASTLTRLGQGRDVSLESLVLLARWAGVSLDGTLLDRTGGLRPLEMVARGLADLGVPDDLAGALLRMLEGWYAPRP
jgi:transcriptional regulator with XRE-family HTH domain